MRGPEPSAKELLERMVAELRARGVHPMTAEEFDRSLEGPSPWPDDDFEAFLAWRREQRRKELGL